MRVKNVQKAAAGIRQSLPVEDKKSVSYAPLEFRRRLSAINEEHISKLAEAIFSQGEKVAKRADISEFQKYRELITQFLNETVSGSYVFSRRESYDVRGRRKTLAIIKRINEKLDEMAAKILSQQANNLQLLALADEIRGLLVDLYL